MYPLLSYFVLYLYLHAFAAARPLSASDKESVGQLRHSGKDVKSSVALVFGKKEKYPRAEYDGKILDDKSSLQQKVHAVKESDENITGNKIKVPYSWEVLHKVSDREVVWKREERSALESPPHKADEATDDVNSKENDANTAEEDVEVMDYAQPHRKSPIHNRG